MSGQEDARYLSSRWPESAEETLSDREPGEEDVSEVTEAPVDPKSTTGYRLAMGAVIGFGVLILIGVTILIIGLAQGWGKHAAAANGKPAVTDTKKPVSMTLAPGYRILSSDTQPGRLILHVRSGTVDEIDIIDLHDGHIIAQIHAEAPN
jgi:hypothetical protein